MESRDYWYWYAGLQTLSGPVRERLLGLFGSPQELFQQPKWPIADLSQAAVDESRRRIAQILAERDGLKKMGISWCCREDDVYPARLKTIPDAPLGLFWKGKLPPDEVPTVGVVGSRRNSTYGRTMAERFAREMGAHGIAVISGMAMGIDGYAQAAALEGGGESYAVLGCGVEQCYPPSNRALYENLCARGGVLSELAPGTPPLPYHFPLRNRIISGLSDILIVIEAREKSGSLITVDQALEQGREVFALPGRLDDPLSVGCNQLIRQGAGILTGLQDIYEALHLAAFAGGAASSGKAASKENAASGENVASGGRSLPAALSVQERKVYNKLNASPIHLEELLDDEETLGELSLILLKLENAGLVRAVTPGAYVRV